MPIDKLAEQLRESRDEWKAKYERAEAAIKEHWRQRGDDRCIEDDVKIYAAVGLPPPDVSVGCQFAMVANCIEFIKNRTRDGGPWIPHVEMRRWLASAKEYLISAETAIRIAAGRVDTDGMRDSLYADARRIREFVDTIPKFPPEPE